MEIDIRAALEHRIGLLTVALIEAQEIRKVLEAKIRELQANQKPAE